MNYTRKIIIALISLTLSACVFQPSVQQGNFIEQDKVEQIEIGMTKNQIRFLLGTPMIDCLLYTSPSPRDRTRSRMPSSA